MKPTQEQIDAALRYVDGTASHDDKESLLLSSDELRSYAMAALFILAAAYRERQYGSIERMNPKSPETVIEVASHDLFAVLDILNAFNYEADEDSCMGMSFFEARLCEDSFFHIKWKLEELLKSSANN